MRRITVLVGSLLLILGIFAESLYVVGAGVASNGLTLSQSTYLVTGIIAIILGFILTWSGVRMPKVRVP